AGAAEGGEEAAAEGGEDSAAAGSVRSTGILRSPWPWRKGRTPPPAGDGSALAGARSARATASQGRIPLAGEGSARAAARRGRIRPRHYCWGPTPASAGGRAAGPCSGGAGDRRRPWR